MHGGKATNAKSDSPTMAALLRGGMLPQASVSPTEMCATRARLRRRTPLMRTGAELFAHVHNTHRQYNLPETGKKMAYKANRAGGAERCEDVAVHKTVEVDLALSTSDEQRLNDLELLILTTAKHHNAHTLSL
jgi:hypothetical protein